MQLCCIVVWTFGRSFATFVTLLAPSWDGCGQLRGRGSERLSSLGVGVVHGKPPADVDYLHVLEGLVIPSNDLLAVLMD